MQIDYVYYDIINRIIYGQDATIEIRTTNSQTESLIKAKGF